MKVEGGFLTICNTFWGAKMFSYQCTRCQAIHSTKRNRNFEKVICRKCRSPFVIKNCQERSLKSGMVKVKTDKAPYGLSKGMVYTVVLASIIMASAIVFFRAQHDIQTKPFAESSEKDLMELDENVGVYLSHRQ